jgi:hypothetical protein
VGCSKYADTKESFIAHAQKVAGIFMVTLVIWALTGTGVFWPGLVLLGLGLKLGLHARRVYGGRSYADADDYDDALR